MYFLFRASHCDQAAAPSTRFIEPLEGRTLLSGGGALGYMASVVHADQVTGLAAAPHANGNSAAKRDARYLQEQSIDNTSEITLSNLAMQQSTNPDVIALANRLITDHTASQQQLEQIATAQGITLQTTDRNDQQEVTRLTKLSGRKFDIAFSQFEVKDHKTGIKSNTTEANKTSNADIQAYAAAQVPVLQQHLALAQTASASSKAESAS